MWAISKIKLKDFKIYSGEYEFVLSPITAIVGRVGAGKSSLLQAIEFALFGREMETRQRIAKIVDLININSDGAWVELELTDGVEKAVIRRSLNRRGRGRLELRMGGKRLLDLDAEEKLKEISGVSSEDYDRVIYISHYALEDFIHGDRVRRTSLIDKILQIDVLDYIQKLINKSIKNILEEIEKIRIKIAYYEKYKDILEKYGSISKVKEVKTSLERELEEISKQENNLLTRYKQLLEDRKKYIDKISRIQDKITAYYRAKSELELLEEYGYSYGAELAQIDELKDRFLGVLAEFEHIVGPQIVEAISRESDPGRLAELFNDAYRELLKAKSSLSELSSSIEAQRNMLIAKLNELNIEISKTKAKLEQLDILYKKFKDLESKYGTIEEVKRKLEAAKNKTRELERKTRYISSLRFILSYALETGVEICPICGSRLDRNVVSSRLKELEGEYSQELAQFEEAKSESEALEGTYREMESLLGSVSEYLKAREELERLSAEAEKTKAKLDQAAKSSAQISRRLSLLSEFLEEVTPEVIEEVVKRYNKALRVKQLREVLESVELELRSLGVSEAVLELEEEFRRVSEDLDKMRRRKADIHNELAKLSEVLANVDEEFEALRSKLERFIYAHNRLNDIYNRLNVVKQNVRSKIVQEIQDELWRNFNKIYPYKDIAAVRLALRDNAYEVEAVTADGATIGISKLSDGQRLAVALSLVISMRKLLGPKLGFLLLDDPLPYVDPNVRSALAGLIASLGREYQVVVATQTEDLPREIASNGVDVAVVELSRAENKPEVTTKHIFGRKD